MNSYRFPDNKMQKYLFGLLVFALLLLNRDGMYAMAALGLYPSLLTCYGLIGVVGIAFLAVNHGKVKGILLDKRMLLAVVSSVILLLPMAVKRDWQLMYINILLCLYIAIFFSFFLTAKEVARWYVTALSVLAVYSLAALYILRPLTDSGLLVPQVIRNSIGVEIYHYGLSFVPLTFVSNRNFGIFREPGVYQFFILLGIYLNNYLVDWDKGWKLWLNNGILAVTMVSTFATGGVIELGLLVVVMFFDKQWYKERNGRLAAALMVLAVGAVGIYCIAVQNGLYWAVYEMFAKFGNNPESVGARVGSIVVNLRYFLSSPLFGKNMRDVLHLVGAGAGVVDNTSSTMILYAVYGIFGGTLNVAAWAALVWKKERKLWGNLSLLVILFMSFNTQNLIWNLFFWLFPMMALVERGLPLCDKFLKKG